MVKKQDKIFLFKIFELLATIGVLGNTLILIIFQNTWPYEELPIFFYLKGSPLWLPFAIQKWR